MGTVITNQPSKLTLHTRYRKSHGILHSQTAPASGQACLRWLHSQLQQDTSGTILRDGGPDTQGPVIHNVCYDEYDQPGSRTQVVPNPEPSRSESAGIEPEPTNSLHIMQEEDVLVLLKCDIVSPVSCSNFSTNTCSILFKGKTLRMLMLKIHY